MATLEEKKEKRAIAEEHYKIEQAGQESDLKARPVIRYLFKEQEDEEAKERNDFLNMLDMAVKSHRYVKTLAKITLKYIKDEDLEPDIYYRVQYTPIGVLMMIGYKGNIYRRAFKASYNPKADLNYCKVFAVSISNLISKLNGEQGSKIYKDEPKIYLPNGSTRTVN